MKNSRGGAGIMASCLLGIIGAALAARAEPLRLPVKVSTDRRYFTDQKNRPVFWLGTTQWQLFRDHTVDEARTILAHSRSNGFVFVHVMLAGVGEGTQANVNGDVPWVNRDARTPNEAYFRHVDAILAAAGEEGMIVSLTLYHQRWRAIIHEGNGRAWARWLARRYRDTPHLVWSMTPEARPEFVPVLRELAAGLREGDEGRHLITFKPDPAPFSSSFIHAEPWLDFNSMQTWRSVHLIHPMVSHDYARKPVKPVLMAEGAYEAGTEYGFEVSPLWVRRQAYYSFLCGGHFTYGHNDSWRVLPTWKKALDAPGARQMGVLRRVFEARKEWWRLVPDQTLLEHGGRTEGEVLNLAARHADGAWLMVYLGAAAEFTLRPNALGPRQVKATWTDPRDGKTVEAGVFPAGISHTFATPAGWEDSLLIVEPAP